jgi:hypothetical protein
MDLKAVWRRALGPRPPAPALERFVGWLAATPYDWGVGPDGKLRAHEGEATLCAVTAVTLSLTGKMYSIGDWVRAADRIGISYADAGLLVAAADGQPASRATRRLRGRLLAAADVASRRRRVTFEGRPERLTVRGHRHPRSRRAAAPCRRAPGHTEMPKTTRVRSPIA